MVKRNNASGRKTTSLWMRMVRLSGLAGVFSTSTRPVRAVASNRVVQKQKRSVGKSKKYKRRSRQRSSSAHRRTKPRAAAHRTVRHRALHRTAVRRRSPAFDTSVQPKIADLPSPSQKRTPFGLPKILFKEIVIPLPRFSLLPKKQAPPIAQDLSSDEPAPVATAQEIRKDEAPTDDLADLLGDAAENVSGKQNAKSTQKSVLDAVKSVASPAPVDAMAAIEAAVRHKRKQAEMREMALQQSSSKKEKNGAKEVEAKQQEKKADKDQRDEVDAQAALERLADAGKVTRKKRSFKTFLRSINNIGMGKQRAAFVQNLAMMLDAGLPLIDAIKTIQDEVRSKPMRAVLQRILDLVEGGNPLWVSMDEQGLFSPYEVSLVRVGEEAGNLARNMELLSIQQEKDRNLRQKVKMAMIYPSIVLTLMFIVVMGLGIFVLPNLIQVLYALNVELPLSTRIVVAFTEFMQVYGLRTAGGMIAAAFVLLLLTKYTSFKAITQWCIFHIPGIGSLAKEASIARFGVILGGLLQAGVPLVESMESLVNVTTMVSFRRFYQKLLERVIVGDSFATCFHSIRGSRKILPGSVQQLIITGEKSGALSDTCMKVAQIYERKAEETAEKLPVILEPTLLLMIGALVGFIAFSIIVPIYSAVGNVGGH